MGPQRGRRRGNFSGLSPPSFRVGVTGHRQFDDVDGVLAQLDEVLDRVCAAREPAELEIWSSLAEGADRHVAHEMIRRGAALVAVLPLEPDEYRLDFATVESRTEFDRLLGLARSVRVVESAEPSREAAYEAAGLTVLDAVDVLVAVWDGTSSRGRGGTADLVGEARRLGREVVIVPVTRDNV